MPELPEVQTLLCDLEAAHVPGQSIEDVRVFWSRSVQPHSVADFRSALQGRSVRGMSRRGKYLIWYIADDLNLLIHLRMTGQFHFVENPDRRDVHDHVLFHLGDGRWLAFRDTRKFGRLRLSTDWRADLGHLGVEPLEPQFECDWFCGALRRSGRQIKPLLLDQKLVAGLGNIYVDEALFAAGIHPKTRASSLDTERAVALWKSIPAVLQRGVDHMGTSLGTGAGNFYSVSRRPGRNQDGLRVFRRQGLPCPHCGTVIERIVVAQRSSHFCPHCQPDS